nr:right-handed parallel beta-helix repeat-containing protein [Candidatus Sigynarchaeota archaeon]
MALALENIHIPVVIATVTISGDGNGTTAGIYIFNCTSVTIVSSCISAVGIGIAIDDSMGISIKETTVQASSKGIKFTSTWHSQVLGGSVSNAGFAGIMIDSSSRNITIDGVSITGNLNDGVFIGVAQAARIHGCTISNNGRGIAIVAGREHCIDGNDIIKNHGNGIELITTQRNQIKNNNIVQNSKNGIELTGSITNVIENNTILMNENDSIYFREPGKARYNSVGSNTLPSSGDNRVLQSIMYAMIAAGSLLVILVRIGPSEKERHPTLDEKRRSKISIRMFIFAAIAVFGFAFEATFVQPSQVAAPLDRHITRFEFRVSEANDTFELTDSVVLECEVDADSEARIQVSNSTELVFTMTDNFEAGLVNVVEVPLDYGVVFPGDYHVSVQLLQYRFPCTYQYSTLVERNFTVIKEHVEIEMGLDVANRIAADGVGYYELQVRGSITDTDSVPRAVPDRQIHFSFYDEPSRQMEDVGATTSESNGRFEFVFTRDELYSNPVIVTATWDGDEVYEAAYDDDRVDQTEIMTEWEGLTPLDRREVAGTLDGNYIMSTSTELL